jgi:glycylpeptide N-tetradecanoyltransferase
LPSTIIQNEKHKLLEAAYLFYYASDVAFEPDADEDDRLSKRIQDLIGDALVIAANVSFLVGSLFVHLQTCASGRL